MDDLVTPKSKTYETTVSMFQKSFPVVENLVTSSRQTVRPLLSHF